MTESIRRWLPELTLDAGAFERLASVVAAEDKKPGEKPQLGEARKRIVLAAGYEQKSNSFIHSTGDRISPPQVYKRSRPLPLPLTNGIIDFIDQRYESQLEKYFILTRVLLVKVDEAIFLDEVVRQRVVNELGETLGKYSSMMGSLDTLKGDAVNEYGHFLLFCPYENQDIAIGEMAISLELDNGQPTRLPRFQTVEYGNSGERIHVAKGFMFEEAGIIYAIARVNGSHLRVSKLQKHSRPKGGGVDEVRNDLVGLRLGGYDYGGRPHCHRIYCYQLAGDDRRSSVSSLLRERGSHRKYDNPKTEISRDFGIREEVVVKIVDFLRNTDGGSAGGLDAPEIKF